MKIPVSVNITRLQDVDGQTITRVTSNSLHTIAEKCGYSSTSYFINTFDNIMV